jgi:superoxide reductase
MSKKWIQTADWKSEKHIPVIEITKVENGRAYVKVSVGKEIPHPNTTAHHIKWIDLFFWPEDEKFPCEIGISPRTRHRFSSLRAHHKVRLHDQEVGHFDGYRLL